MKSKEDIKGLTLDELNEKLREVQDEYENLVLQKATHQLTNPIRIRFVRREIARIKTFIRQQELGINIKA
ncbi:MAG: 50S ribosomal protein L29 [Calditrichaceae bacterium]